MKKWFLFEGILLAVFGLLLILFPAFWVKVAVILLGLGAIAYGIYNIKFTRTLYKDTLYERSLLVKSIISIVVGVIVVFFPLVIVRTAWNAMIWVLVIYMIVSAVLGFFAAALLKDTGIERKRYFLENLILLAIAIVLIILSPSALGTFIVRLIGLVALVAGGTLITYEIISKKNKPVEAEFKDVSTEDTPEASDDKEE